MQGLISEGTIPVVLDCLVHFQGTDQFLEDGIFSQLGFLLKYMLLYIQQNSAIQSTGHS